MDFYSNMKNVKNYIEMAEGYDGRYLIQKLKKYLPEGSTVLELGMGPGKDLNLLQEDYSVTGSDYSQEFLDVFIKENENSDIELLVIDARVLDINQKFDCIYSNKVLYHLTEEELVDSLNKQWELLNENGLLLHSFWKGNKQEEQYGLTFVHYTEEILRNIVDDKYEILEIETYNEMEKDDSLYIILKKRVNDFRE